MSIPFPTMSAFRRWKRARAAKSARSKNPLREFLYLDETSVHSLYASRFGPIPSEYTSTSGWTRQAEIGGTLEANAPGLKSALTPRVSSSENRSEQVLRKASVQATYKEWYNFERDAILLRDANARKQPSAKTLEALTALAEKKQQNPWIVKSDNLHRGTLLELQVELRAAHIFRMSSIVSEMIDIFRDLPQSIVALHEQVVPVESMVRLIERFLVGLIPIESRAIEFITFTYGEQEYIVHRALLRALRPSERPPTGDLYIVGVTERDLYWKDIRRILFSKPQVTVLVRVGTDKVQTEWNEVKLLDLLGELDPTAVSKVREGLLGIDSTSVSGPTHQTEDVLYEKRVEALEYHARRVLQSSLGDENSTAHRTDIITAISAKAREEAQNFDSSEARRRAFREIEGMIASGIGFHLDPDLGPELRTKSLLACGLDRHGHLEAGSQSALSILAADSENDQERYIDSEIISISW